MNAPLTKSELKEINTAYKGGVKEAISSKVLIMVFCWGFGPVILFAWEPTITIAMVLLLITPPFAYIDGYADARARSTNKKTAELIGVVE